MRIDLALSYLCIVKTRSQAKSLCDKGAVILNGAPARASATVKAGDTVTISYPRKRTTVRILEAPSRQLSKAAAPSHYEVVETVERADEPDGW